MARACDAHPAGTHRVVLALGSNLGDRLANLQAAVDALADGSGLTLIAISPVYETKPVGGPPQPDYLNAVLIAASDRPARQILDWAHRVEKALHRSRDVRWGARTIDIDIIAYGGESSSDPELTLPHPRAHERAFVLVPWLDADPCAVLPGRGPVADLLARLPAAGVRRCSAAALRLPRSN